MNFFAPTFAKRLLFFLTADFILFFVSLHFAYALRFDFEIPAEHMAKFYTIFFILTLLKWGSFQLFGIYRLTWRFFGLHDAKRLFYAHVSAIIGFFIFFWFDPDLFNPMPRSAIGIDLILSFVLITALRLSKRVLIESSKLPTHIPAFIIGISENTANIIKSALDGSGHYYPAAIVTLQEKNRSMIGSTIQNLEIVTPDKMEKLIQTKHITAAIIDGSLSGEYLREAYRLLSNAGIRDIKRAHLLDEMHNTIETLSIEELLARHPKDLDTKTIGTFIHNKTVLITGGGGSIGSEIALQCHRFGAKKLILIDHSEYNLYQIGEKIPAASLHLCNILDRPMLDSILKTSQPDIVIHAAAYKHVPLCEANVHPAILNNIQGSCNVIDSAVEHNVPKIVIISTDKAVRPTNVMGATKRVVELYAQNIDPRNSEIVSVRFGNVLGSSGSVIPKFKSQIEAGGPVTITHPEVERYFMMIGEACQLVLQAAAIARGGELFILDMGEPVKIIDLARTMIRLYAAEPVDIIISGLRPGEKLFEELLIDESERKTVFESIMIARSTLYPIEKLKEDIEALFSSDRPIDGLQKIVPEFMPAKI